MQALPGIPHKLNQTFFYIKVHVFKIEQPGKGSRFNFAADLRHAAFDIC